MRVGLFVTCLVDLMRPSIGMAALKLLEDAGCEVTVPAMQTCCGQPGWNSGDRKSARSLAEKLIAEFEDCRYVVVPSGSCTGMIRTHFAEVFEDEPAMLAKTRRLAARTYELTEFLTKMAKRAPGPASFNGTVTYHDSCSGLREIGVKAQPRQLLAKVAGTQARRDGRVRSLLRVRRHLFHQVRGDLLRDGGEEMRKHRGERRAGGRARRPGLHAEHRGAAAPAR